jgi:tRNA U34 5-carboxymethylaminomethyl modifying GTPase MnmE/TrmE
LFVFYSSSITSILSWDSASAQRSAVHLFMAKQKPAQPSRRRSLSDPLAAFLLPPPNETPEQRDARLLAEIEAKKISDSIDEMIRRESVEKKKNRAEVHVLLLGQSESGKSTTLKRKYGKEYLQQCLNCEQSSNCCTRQPRFMLNA